MLFYSAAPVWFGMKAEAITLMDFDRLNQAAREVQKLLERNASANEIVRNAAYSPAMRAVKAAQEDPTIQRWLDDVEYHRALMRSVEGPVSELRKAGVSDLELPIQQELQRTQLMMSDFQERFTLPEQDGVRRLVQQFQQSPFSEVITRYSEQAAELRKAMEAMRSPWLDAQQALQSVIGFAEIQGIGGILARMPAFDDQVCIALRVDLGDWRDRIVWPKNVVTDLSARAEFYEGLGFDPSVTDFPASAFQESLEIAGLRREPPSLVDAYGDPLPPADDAEEEAALIRTNFAHDWLQRLETNLRRFIDAQMTRAFGPDWPKHRLPNGLYEQWVQKRQEAVKAGRKPKPLVAYADFTDYERVICKKDNWQQVFLGYFGRPESVRESFQRLHLIRLDTMHARPIGQEDELLLYVEIRRLVRVII